MIRVELDWDDELNIFCPFCGKPAFGEAECLTCEHTLFHCSDHGFEYIHPQLSFTDQEVEESGEGYDSFTDALNIPQSVKFALYQPAPCFLGGYVGFSNHPFKA